VFPIWDIIFRTADFSPEYLPTGDRRAPESMATGGYVAQQMGGLQFFISEFRKATAVRRNS
jgi:hypothetical protein